MAPARFPERSKLENLWLISALWIGLALVASLISIRLAISVALVEIIVGAIAGNTIGLEANDWINYLAGVGAILLTFLAGAEIDPAVIKKHFWSSVSIGVVSFLAPFLGVLAYAKFICNWSLPQSEIAAIALSGTSVAVVFAVMIETGFNKTELGKIILAACFITDVGLILALGLLFANHNIWLAIFALVTVLTMWLLPKMVPWFFEAFQKKISEPELKLMLFVLFLLGGLSNIAKSEAVLPAYLLGMVLAPILLKQEELTKKLRVMMFTIFTPFYFLKAGSLIEANIVLNSFGLITMFFLAKVGTKFIGVFPITKAFKFETKNGIYTTLMMSTGLTFGSIAALFGYTEKIITQDQYTIILTAVIGSALIPTMIAHKWFEPKPVFLEEKSD